MTRKHSGNKKIVIFLAFLHTSRSQKTRCYYFSSVVAYVCCLVSTRRNLPTANRQSDPPKGTRGNSPVFCNLHGALCEPYDRIALLSPNSLLLPRHKRRPNVYMCRLTHLWAKTCRNVGFMTFDISSPASISSGLMNHSPVGWIVSKNVSFLFPRGMGG
jgi:hypothetical protein